MVRILCVDDDAMILRGLSAMIQRIELPGAQIITASNALDALEILGHSGADIVISDIDMPIMNGLELIRIANERRYCKHYIILTGFDKFEYVREAIRNNVCDYMLKPINKQELCDNLRRLHALILNEPAPDIDQAMEALGLTCFDVDREAMPKKFRRILEFIDERYQIDLSLEMLAEAQDLHPNYICALFREHLDTTFLHYLDIVRLKRSVHLLAQRPVLVIKDVATGSGFVSDRHFYKVFKKRLGRTPASVREMWQESTAAESS